MLILEKGVRKENELQEGKGGLKVCVWERKVGL